MRDFRNSQWIYGNRSVANADGLRYRRCLVDLAIMKETCIYRHGNCLLSQSPSGKSSNNRAINPP